MNEYLIGVFSAFGFGMLMSISPCPLATNIAAITYISRDLSKPRQVLLTGLLYTAGRTLAYLVLGIILVYSLTAALNLSQFLQKSMNQILGPILIIVGMLLLELIKINVGGGGVSEKMQKRFDSMGLWGAFPLGILFALSFCPVSAGLFFGSLLGIAVQLNSAFLIPAVFGIGTALPVIVFSFLIMFGMQTMAKVFGKIQQFEYWARRVTGLVFIFVGLYYCMVYIFEIL